MRQHRPSITGPAARSKGGRPGRPHGGARGSALATTTVWPGARGPVLAPRPAPASSLPPYPSLAPVIDPRPKSSSGPPGLRPARTSRAHPDFGPGKLERPGPRARTQAPTGSCEHWQAALARPARTLMIAAAGAAAGPGQDSFRGRSRPVGSKYDSDAPTESQAGSDRDSEISGVTSLLGQLACSESPGFPRQPPAWLWPSRAGPGLQPSQYTATDVRRPPGQPPSQWRPSSDWCLPRARPGRGRSDSVGIMIRHGRARLSTKHPSVMQH